jgi:hypothetical protein
MRKTGRKTIIYNGVNGAIQIKFWKDNKKGIKQTANTY